VIDAPPPSAPNAPRGRAPRVLISIDMEGIGGISGWTQCRPGDRAWIETGRRLMAEDLRAAVEGLLKGGAGDISVCDSHWSSENLAPEEVLAMGAKELRSGDLYKTTMIPGIEKADALVLLGTHGAAGGGYFSHTVQTGLELVLSGHPVGEVGLNLLSAADLGVPTLLVQGDDAVRLSPDVSTVRTKIALKGKVVLDSALEARAELRRKAEAAVQDWISGRTATPERPMEGMRARTPRSAARKGLARAASLEGGWFVLEGRAWDCHRALLGAIAESLEAPGGKGRPA